MNKHPAAVLPAIRNLEFVCPRCKGELSVDAVQYSCKVCHCHYPVFHGIPDFRIFPDPYLDFDEDAKRTAIIIDKLDELPLPKLLEYYWTYSDVTPPLLRKKFVQNALRGEARGARLYNLLRQKQLTGGVKILEIGCGTGNFLARAIKHGNQVVGADIAMRWLHLSRRRFMDLDLPVPALVCCCAEYLPFKDNAFELEVMASTLEFLKSPSDAFAESARVMKPGGQLLVNTVNRFSLAKNPYAHLWGVGFLPKKYQVKYVRYVRDASFENIELHSMSQISRLARQHYTSWEINAADINESVLKTLPKHLQGLIWLYRLMKRMPAVKFAVKLVAPEWDIRLTLK